MYYTFINDINKKLKNMNIKARDLLKKNGLRGKQNEENTQNILT